MRRIAHITIALALCVTSCTRKVSSTYHSRLGSFARTAENVTILTSVTDSFSADLAKLDSLNEGLALPIFSGNELTAIAQRRGGRIIVRPILKREERQRYNETCAVLETDSLEEEKHPPAYQILSEFGLRVTIYCVLTFFFLYFAMLYRKK